MHFSMMVDIEGGTSVKVLVNSFNRIPNPYISVLGVDEPKPYCSGAAYPFVPNKTVSLFALSETHLAALKSLKTT